MRLSILLPLGFFFSALLSGCSLLSNNEDFNKAFLLPLSTKNNQIVPSILWSISIGNGIGNFYSKLHPTYANGTVYAADRKGVVKAVNVHNGKEVWSTNLAERDGWLFRIPALLSGGISVYNDHVYIGSEKAQVYALCTKNGAMVWQANVAGEVLSCPIVSDDIVLVHTSNGQLQALNAVDGKVKWITNLDVPSFSLRGESSPVVTFSGSAIIIGNDNGRVSAISTRQGQIIWQQRISQIIGSTEIDRLRDVDAAPLVIEDSVIYAIAYNGKLTALDLYSGQIISEYNLNSSINDFIFNEGRIYLVDQSDRILALNTKGNAILWMQNALLHRLLTAPVLYNRNLVVGDSKGYIYWIDPENGQLLLHQKVDYSGFLAKPIIADDKLLIQAKSGKLYAILR